MEERFIDIEGQIEDINGALDTVIGDIKTLKEPEIEQLSQLLYPLDGESKKIIRDSLEFPFPVVKQLQGTVPASAANYGIVFISDRDHYEVVSVSIVFTTAGSSDGTLQIERLQGTETISNGDDLLSSTLDLTATANTVQHGTLIADKNTLTLSKGDRLALQDAGTLTSIAGLQVTIFLRHVNAR